MISIIYKGQTEENDVKKEEGEDRQMDCGVSEEAFPCLQRCCEKTISESEIKYSQSCPYCIIWISMPDSADLVVNYILECSLCGYGKRIKAWKQLSDNDFYDRGL